jgi:hypothetical protein
MRALLVIAVSVLAAACQSAAPAQTAGCPVVDSRDWSAHIDAMPGPGAQRTLIVTGEVDLPTPGYTVRLTVGPADRSAIPVQQMILVAQPPGGTTAQVVTPHPVRYDGRAIAEHYRAVRVMCGGEQLADLEVTVAH